MTFVISKTKDRICIPDFLRYVRSLPCCACGKRSTASHMKSIKYADGSDALAINACMPDHHVQSTKTSREILVQNGIDIEQQHRTLWIGFAATKNVKLEPDVSQAEFELFCELRGWCKKPPTKRKANFR